MKKETKIQFNPDLLYQKEAVDSAIKLFGGQIKTLSPFTISRGEGVFQSD